MNSVLRWGRRRTAKGFTDKAETKRLAAQLEDESRMIRKGLRVPVSASDRKPPLEHHLDAFEEHLRNREVQSDRRYDRRPLSIDEFLLLIDASGLQQTETNRRPSVPSGCGRSADRVAGAAQARSE